MGRETNFETCDARRRFAVDHTFDPLMYATPSGSGGAVLGPFGIKQTFGRRRQKWSDQISVLEICSGVCVCVLALTVAVMTTVPVQRVGFRTDFGVKCTQMTHSSSSTIECHAVTRPVCPCADGCSAMPLCQSGLPTNTDHCEVQALMARCMPFQTATMSLRFRLAFKGVWDCLSGCSQGCWDAPGRRAYSKLRWGARVGRVLVLSDIENRRNGRLLFCAGW